MGLVNYNLRHTEKLFGLDIGQTSLKVMQLEQSAKGIPKVIGYGVSGFYPSQAIKDGEIVDSEIIAKMLKDLLEKDLVGSITTNRVACTLPTAHAFSRPMKVPKMNKDHLEEAIELETEQYIPLSPDKLYLDYEITGSDDQNTELLVMAAPRNVVDSYMSFLEDVGLHPVALEPSMNAVARLFRLADSSHDQPSVLVDFGSLSIDIAVFDKSMFVNSTIEGGSDTITAMIAKQLGVSPKEAYSIKNKEGLSYSDELRDLVPAIKPILDSLVKEIRRNIRYYDDRSDNKSKISQVITSGGGATLKGLNEYLTRELKLPVRMLDPWQKIDFGDLAAPNIQAKSMYLAVAGEAIITSSELHS